LILKNDSKNIYIVTKKASRFSKNISAIVFCIDNNKNVSKASNQHIHIISKGSCDVESGTGLHYISKYIKKETRYFI